MSLLPCLRCGRTDPRRMIGLMTLWFSRFLEEPAEGGYFYLCPACYNEMVAPHMSDVRRQVLAVHPRLQRQMHADNAAGDGAAPTDTAAADPPADGDLPPLSA